MEISTAPKDPLTEEDLEHLEVLVRSPVFRSLRKLLNHYRDECQGRLLTEPDANRVFEMRGRIIGINVIENLPQVRAQQLMVKKAAAAKIQAQKDALSARDFKKRPERAPGKKSRAATT